jgi:tricorn protease-like protein
MHPFLSRPRALAAGILSRPRALAAGMLAATALASASLSAQPAPPSAGLPLKAARTHTFTTSKGTWMSVDVSPDGQTLVFDLLGDLYTMPITGGTATRLTSGMAYDAQPRYAPDGKSVVFVSDRSGGDNVWTLALDTRDSTQVTKGNNNLYISPEYSPDGKYIVASRSGGLGGIAKLWMYHVDGGNGVPLSTQPAAPPTQKQMGAAFGSNPRFMWFATRTGDWQYNSIGPQYQLAVWDRENGRVSQMSTRYGSGARPALSPDGKWLVYATRFETKTGLMRPFPVLVPPRAHGRLPRLCLHPRLKGHRRELRRGILACAHRQDGARENPLRRRSEVGAGPRGEVRVQGGHHAHLYGAADSRPATVARRQVAGVHGA